MRPIPATRLGDSHGLLRAIEKRGRLRTDEFVTEFNLDELFPPGLENALGRMRHYISYGRLAGLVKEDRGVVELTEIGKRYIRAADQAAPYEISAQQAEWLRRQLREKHMTDSIFHGLAIALSLLASVPPGTRIATMDFGRSMAYLGRAGWDNENTLAIQGERHLVLLTDLELIDGDQRLTPTGEQIRGELTLPVHMSLLDIAGQLNPGGPDAVRQAAALEWEQPEPPAPAPVADEAPAPVDPEVDDDDNGYKTVVGAPIPSTEPPRPPIVPRAGPPQVAADGPPPETPPTLSPGDPLMPFVSTPRESGPVAEPPPAASVGPPAPSSTPQFVPEPPAPDLAASSGPPPSPVDVAPPSSGSDLDAPPATPEFEVPAGPAPTAEPDESAAPPAHESFAPPPVSGVSAGPPPAEEATVDPDAPADLAPAEATPPPTAEREMSARTPEAEEATPPMAEPHVSAGPPPWREAPPPMAEPDVSAGPPPWREAAPPTGEPDVSAGPPPKEASPPAREPEVATGPPSTPEDSVASPPVPEVSAGPPPVRQRAPEFVGARAIQAAGEGAGLRLPMSVYANAAAGLAAGKHLVLTGAPGAGKTALALAIARAATQAGRAHGATVVTAAGDWAPSDLLVDAARQGRWVIADELHRAQPDAAFASLSSFLAGIPVSLPGAGEAAAADGWRIVATWGGAPPRGAVLRRFAVVEVVGPSAEELRAALHEAAGGDATAARAAERLLPFAELTPLGAGVFLDAARHAATRNDAAPADDATLAREAYIAYVAPLLGDTDEDRVREVLGDQ